MSSDYTYDENGQFFPFFILTITGIITVPVTYSLLKPSKELESTAPRIPTDFKPEHADLIDGQRRKQKRRERKLKRGISAIGGWAIMAFMVYLILVTQRTAPKVWDPHSILGVSLTASEKQIKSHYRKLSLSQHPDKVKLDPAKNETIESANENWVEITKAFKALTDEEIRRNYLEYGHPDGKQGFSIGIALPKFIVAEGSGRYVLGLYGLFLGVLLPYVVGKWWYGQQRVTKEKVLVSSAGKLFKEYEDGVSEGGLVGVLSSGDEYKDIFKGDKSDSGLAKLEQRVLRQDDNSKVVAGLSDKDLKKLRGLDDGPRRKVLGLLWAYLARVELEDAALDDEKFEVAPTALVLNDAYTNISLAYGNTAPLLSSYHIAQCLIQAVPPNGSPLLQLPHFTPTIVKAVEGEMSRGHLTVQDFLRLPAPERKKRAVGTGKLTEAQYQTAVKLAGQLPLLHLDRAFFKVTGERFITPSSLVTFVLKCRIVSPSTLPIPAASEKDLEDVDPREGDLDALKSENAEPSEPIPPPVANAPYFARDHSPRWHVFLADSKQGKIAVPPFTFSTFDKPIFTEQGGLTGNVQTLKMQFGAPPQPGHYTFVMHLVCDSYLGMDVKKEVTLIVEDGSKALEIIEEEEPSDPEEDTLAGQLGAMRGQKTKKTQQEEDEDESDTEGEVESESETDTDTEDEGE